MKAKTMIDFLFAVSVVLVLLFVNFVVMVVIELLGGARFYGPLWSLFVVGCVVYYVLWRFWREGRPLLGKGFRWFCILCLLAVLGRVGYQSYRKSLRVEEREVDINVYRPFAPDTLAVSLEEPAELRFEGEPPRLDGATALYPIYAAFARATYPEADYPPRNSLVMCSKTGTAYERLIAGETDIIFVARPSQAHLDLAAEKGVELTLTPIGREAFVFFVNESNPVQGLTLAQIQAIYSGEITHWRELGGPDLGIQPFQRPENSGSQTMLQHIMQGKTLMKPPEEDVVAGMGGIIARTASYHNTRGAMGYTFRYFASTMVADRRIRFLEVDGVAPRVENIASERYPLTTHLYAVTAGSTNPNVAHFLEWILSEQGQEIVRRSGYVPIRSHPPSP